MTLQIKSPQQHNTGFTLVELITVMVITGIVSMMAVNMITLPMKSFADMKRRAELVDIAEITLQRMAREIHHALPNSVRVPDQNRIEILHTIDGGRYAADSFDTSSTTSQFGLLKKLADTTKTAVQTATHYVVVYNLGESRANAYNFDNMSAIVSPYLSDSTIDYNAIQFPFNSPNHRFMIVDKAITFGCSDGSLYLKQNYSITNNTPSIDTNSDNLLANKVTNCHFKYAAGTATRPGLVTMEIEITDSGETISLLHQVTVENQP